MSEIEKIVCEVLTITLNLNKQINVSDVYYRLDIKLIKLNKIREELEKNLGISLEKLNIMPTDTVSDTIRLVSEIKKQKERKIRR